MGQNKKILIHIFFASLILLSYLIAGCRSSDIAVSNSTSQTEVHHFTDNAKDSTETTTSIIPLTQENEDGSQTTRQLEPKVFQASFTVREGTPITFPLQSDGYPRRDVVIINDNEYPLGIDARHPKTDIKVSLQNLPECMISIILPSGLDFCEWNLEENEDIDLCSYSRVMIPVAHLREGAVSDVESFTFRVAPNVDKVSFKYINKKEKGKSFNTKEGVYELTLTLSFIK